jgi:hypothetical protein
MKKPVFIVVLNDGETFTDLSGCKLIRTDSETCEKAISEGMDGDEIMELPNAKTVDLESVIGLLNTDVLFDSN